MSFRRGIGGWSACGMTMLLAAALPALANNLCITNVMVIGRDSSTAFVQFDIKWENSWRYTNVNHDAALDSATGNANVPNWPGTGSSTRGGDWSDAAIMARSSDRWVACYGYADSASGRVGGRAVRTAPSGVGP